MSIKKDYFLNQSMVLYQHTNHFHFNTDTKLLAQFIRLKKNETVLDIGTNNGALLLACDQYPVRKLIGVEILEASFKMARLNAKLFFQHPYELYNTPVQQLSIDPVDVIVSNPPYFTTKETNPHVQMTPRQLGRVENNLTLEELIQNANRLLKSNGRFYFVHRLHRLNEIIDRLHTYHFQVRHLQIAYTKDTYTAKSLLIEAIKESHCDCVVGPPIFI